MQSGLAILLCTHDKKTRNVVRCSSSRHLLCHRYGPSVSTRPQTPKPCRGERHRESERNVGWKVQCQRNAPSGRMHLCTQTLSITPNGTRFEIGIQAHVSVLSLSLFRSQFLSFSLSCAASLWHGKAIFWGRKYIFHCLPKDKLHGGCGDHRKSRIV